MTFSRVLQLQIVTEADDSWEDEVDVEDPP